MGESCICPYVMDNGWSCMDSNVSSWYVFYLKCDKGRKNNSYQIYVKLYYFYVLVLHFFL
jgi:hypothetical protein